MRREERQRGSVAGLSACNQVQSSAIKCNQHAIKRNQAWRACQSSWCAMYQD